MVPNTLENTISIGEGSLPSEFNYLIRNFNVPYVVRSRKLEVKGSLTIEPGTKLFFREFARLVISNNATFSAIGTANAPITFSNLSELTNPDDNTGYWVGIEFIQGVASNPSENLLSYVRIAYAGNGQSPITLKNNTVVSIDHSTIENSASAQPVSSDISSTVHGLDDLSNDFYSTNF